MIVVTGVTGKLGGAIAALLRDRGVPFRAVARSIDNAPFHWDQGVAYARGDYADPASLQAAFAGAERVFITSLQAQADRWKLHANAIHAALRAGARQIVYLSYIDHDKRSPCPMHSDHGLSEEVLIASGAPRTIVRSGHYVDFVFQAGDDEGVIRGDFGEGRLSLVTRADIAEAVAHVLTTPGHLGRAYTITGPDSLSIADVARILSEETGKQHRYLSLPWEENAAWLRARDYPEPVIQIVRTVWQTIREGRIGAVSTDFERLIGRAPTSFQSYLRKRPAVVRP